MKINENCIIIGKRVVLVPYKVHHVDRYHSWMQSEELQKLTASEPLTLEEEYAMQKSWHIDESKCTFIILDKEKWQERKEKEEDCMCGDVNLFLNDPDDNKTAEIEIMIAEKSCRGKGFGKEALWIMMQYGVDKLGLKNYTAKIGSTNITSLAMFKKFGFKEISFSEVFQEVTLAFNTVEEKLLTIPLKLVNKEMEEKHDTNCQEIYEWQGSY